MRRWNKLLGHIYHPMREQQSEASAGPSANDPLPTQNGNIEKPSTSQFIRNTKRINTWKGRGGYNLYETAEIVADSARDGHLEEAEPKSQVDIRMRVATRTMVASFHTPRGILRRKELLLPDKPAHHFPLQSPDFRQSSV